MRPTIALFLWLTAATLGAQPWLPEPSLEGVRLVGGDLGLNWDAFRLTVGAGWEWLDFDRSAADGSLASKTSPAFPNAGVEVRYTAVTGIADFWVAAGALGYQDFASGVADTGRFPDRTGGVFGFVRAGATRDRRTVNDHGLVSGTNLKTFVEAGPALLAVRGTDYVKAVVMTSWLVPLWDLEGANQTFSGTLGLRANLQWISGSTVPVPLLEPTEVRGYDGLFDTRLRTVATAELRTALPSLWGPHDLVPVVFAFGEGGWYSGWNDAPAALAGQNGWLASMGGGFGLSIFGAATPTFTVALPLHGESALWWKINFDLAF